MKAVRRAVGFILAALVLLLLPRAARAEGVLYVAHDASRLFPLARTEVRADIAGEVISTTVAETFKNPFPERIEAVYVFPLPDQAAVDDMEMHVGARVVRAEIKRRVEAQAAYDQAARQGRRAALLEQERPNVFTFSVANVDPGGEITVRLHYFEIAHYDHGTYEMAFPMVVGPRYIPGAPLPRAPSGTGTRADTDRVPDASRVSPAYVPPGVRSGHALALTVNLDAGAPLETVESVVHDVDVARPSAAVATVTLRDRAEIANRDFVLRWRLAASELRTALFTYRPAPDRDGYLALLIEPKHEIAPAEFAPRELFFLLDTSGSMTGTPLSTALDAVRRTLDGMHPSDTFQIIDFADTASSFAPSPVPNTQPNVRRAREYLSTLRASGGTNQLAGIHAALSAPGDATRLRDVVFMTDGYIGNETQVIDLVRHEIGRARIYGFGVGSSVNRYLLDEVSHAGRGTAEYLLPQENPNALVERFYQRIGSPYVTDVSVDWGGLPVADVVPAAIGDLSALEPLVVFARYHGAGSATVKVRGKLGGRPFEHPVRVTLPEAAAGNGAIERVWARQEITELSRLPRMDDVHERAITELALAHRLVSPFTSLVAVDSLAPVTANAFPMLVLQPSEAPEGLDVQSAGGAYAQPSAPPPAPAEERIATEEAAPRHGGCAGCTLGKTAPAAAQALGGLVLLLLLLLRRRRRGWDEADSP